ncbi:MAG: mandelate racemase/muconate lactonizing enzyme family protein [Planctomycetaceae bacterium]
MRIASVTAYHLRVPLRMRITHASHSRNANDTLIIACRLTDGTVGWGEGLPRPYVTGETIETVFDLLDRGNMIPQVFGWPIDQLKDLVQCCRDLVPSDRPAGTRAGFGNTVRCALELSLLDAVTRSLNVPLGAVFSHIPEIQALRTQSTEIEYSAIFPKMPNWKTQLYARWVRYAGMRHVKAKVGIAGIDDIALLRKIRRGIGPRVDLRIDANEAWTPPDLERQLDKLLPLDISCIEQPVPHEQIDGLAGIKGNSAIPIMLDESVCTLEELDTAIERNYCDLINLRISKCGGLINSCLLAAVAHQARLGYQLGCQVGETGILSAAGRHLAASLSGIRYFEGSYDRLLLERQFTSPDISCGWNGRAAALTTAGLGVEIDESKLRQLMVREVHYQPGTIPRETEGNRT